MSVPFRAEQFELSPTSSAMGFQLDAEVAERVANTALAGSRVYRNGNANFSDIPFIVDAIGVLPMQAPSRNDAHHEARKYVVNTPFEDGNEVPFNERFGADMVRMLDREYRDGRSSALMPAAFASIPTALTVGALHEARDLYDNSTNETTGAAVLIGAGVSLGLIATIRLIAPAAEGMYGMAVTRRNSYFQARRMRRVANQVAALGLPPIVSRAGESS